jgi:hypothetical protein
MSLCAGCWTQFLKQYGAAFASFAPVTKPHISDYPLAEDQIDKWEVYARWVDRVTEGSCNACARRTALGNPPYDRVLKLQLRSLTVRFCEQCVERLKDQLRVL